METSLCSWLRFKRNKLGYRSLLIFCAMVLLSLCAELVSNDRPLLVRYENSFYFPMVKDYPEKTFGGDFDTTTDFLDPFIREKLAQGSNWAVYAPNPYGPKTLNYFVSKLKKNRLLAVSPNAPQAFPGIPRDQLSKFPIQKLWFH